MRIERNRIYVAVSLPRRPGRATRIAILAIAPVPFDRSVPWGPDLHGRLLPASSSPMRETQCPYCEKARVLPFDGDIVWHLKCVTEALAPEDDADASRTQSEIGKLLGMTRARVGQIEAHALHRTGVKLK